MTVLNPNERPDLFENAAYPDHGGSAGSHATRGGFKIGWRALSLRFEASYPRAIRQTSNVATYRFTLHTAPLHSIGSQTGDHRAAEP